MSSFGIIDDIDALIDEQLAAGERGQESRALTADRPCWHCGRAWHGLAITTRLEEMRREYQRRANEAYDRGEEIEYATSAILDGYRYDADTSEVLCPGSGFIGPMPAHMRRIVGDPVTGCTCDSCRINAALTGWNGMYSLPPDPDLDRDPAGLGLFQQAPGAWASWRAPDAWVGAAIGRPWLIQPQPASAPRWWRIDFTQFAPDEPLPRFEIETEDDDTRGDDTRGVDRGFLLLAQAISNRRASLLVRVGTGLDQYRSVIELIPEDGVYLRRQHDPGTFAPLTLDIRACVVDDCAGRLVWHEITGPGGDYVHSRALVPASAHVDWYRSRNLDHLLPRQLRLREAFSRLGLQMQQWQERMVEHFSDFAAASGRAAANIQNAWREAFPEFIDAPTTTPLNRAARRHATPNRDPYWIQRADRQRGRR